MFGLVGQSLGRYHILEQLGEGGMASVYKAFDTRLERNVAIKVILPSHEQSEQFLKRFDREAKALAHLSHPNIVKVLDYGQQEGIPYLVMEYIPGGTLKQKLGQSIHWQEAARTLIPIARALQYAHQESIVHRDVKPANILLTRSGEPMLSDFGIAKILESEESLHLTGTGVGIGTPEYMAPEQGMGQGVDHRADIYALGVVLYEMVTGRKPYQADTPMAVMLKKVTDPLPRPKQFMPSLPDAVENVLLKALAKNPQDRYSDMDAFARALENLSAPERSMVNEEATVVVPEEKSTIVPSERPPARKKLTWWFWAAGCGGVACLAVVTVIIILANNGVFSGNGEKPSFLTPATSNVQPSPESFASPLSTQVSASTDTPFPTNTPFLNATTTSLPSGPQGKIVYTCQVSRVEGKDQICIINADGTNSRQVTNNNSENFYASLAPDGQHIVFSSNQIGGFQIYEMDLYGYQTQLTFGMDAYAPEISPDGRYILFRNDDGGSSSIWIMNRNGSDPHSIYSSPPNQDAEDPTWSPDGEQILFALGKDYEKQLYIINRDGSGAYQINTTFRTRGRSDWSPDGLLISAYAKLSNGLRGIFVMNVDGSGLSQVSLGGDVVAPSFSPDSQWITFMGYIDNPGNSDGCEIYITRLDGSQLKRLTNNGYCDYQPRWGP